MYILYTRTSVI